MFGSPNHSTIIQLQAKQMGRTAMSTSLEQFRDVNASFAREFNPWGRLRSVVLVFDDGQQFPVPVMVGAGVGCGLPPVVVAPSTSTHPDLPDLTPLQRKIIKALAAKGPLKGKTLATACGLDQRTSIYGDKGVTRLLQAGVIDNDSDAGYGLTPFGQDIAAELDCGK